MKTKNSIGIRADEKEIYRIFKDLEKHGRTTFSYPNLSKHRGIARSIGIRVSPLVERKLIFPPLSSTNKHRMTGIQLPTDVKIKEEKDGEIHRFFFYHPKNRRNNIF